MVSNFCKPQGGRFVYIASRQNKPYHLFETDVVVCIKNSATDYSHTNSSLVTMLLTNLTSLQ